MAGKRIHVVMSDELVEQIDAALGVGQSRGDWLRRAVEQALRGENHERALAGQRPLGLAIQQAARPSSQAKRGVEPRPKKAR